MRQNNFGRRVGNDMKLYQVMLSPGCFDSFSHPHFTVCY